MKRCAGLVFGLLVAGLPGYADTVYMDDGTVLEGKIVSRQEEVIVLQTEQGKEEINWKYIKRTVVDSIAPASGDSDDFRTGNKAVREARTIESSGSMEDEGAIKIGIDLPGKHDIDGTINGYAFNGSESTVLGASVSGEYVLYINVNAGLGAGATLQLPRKQSDYDGQFNFWPVYALLKLRTTPGRSGGYQYLLGQAGYNFFFGDNMYKGTNSELSGGIYYGVGAGMNLAGTQIELLYSVNQGSLKQKLYTYSPYYGYSFYDIKGNVKYPKLSLTLGFYF